MYLKQNKLTHINELIPKTNYYENANIIGNINLLNEILAGKIRKIFSIDQNK